MAFEFEELDYQLTRLGAISLRKRAEPRLDGVIVYEVKLGDEYLMSSLFTEAEVALARLGLGCFPDQTERSLDVIVGGLGLGYTAAATLEHEAVGTLTVIELLPPVIDWHRRAIVPLGDQLCADRRCTLVEGDFFFSATSPGGFFPDDPSRKVHAILLDIDHSPEHWLNEKHGSFYSEDGLRKLSDKLRPGGIFGLWSDDPPDNDFKALLDRVFASSETHVVTFANPYTGGESSNTVYLARTRNGSGG